MHLIEILLPLTDNEGKPFPAKKYATVRNLLMAEFGGMTAFTRAPAEGLFETGGRTVRDDIVVLEVMAPSLDRDRWRALRRQFEQEFVQDEIVIRASRIERL